MRPDIPRLSTRVRAAAVALCCSVAMGAAATAPAVAADWSGWDGGPTHNFFRSDHPGLDVDELWSGPPLSEDAPPDCTTAVGGRVYVVVPDEQAPADKIAHAVDASDGSIEWSSAPITGGKTCPAVDADNVYVTRPGAIVALDRDDGSIAWTGSWGTGAAMTYPLASEGLVVVGGYDALVNYVIRAFDASDGSFEWEAPGPYNSVLPPIDAGGTIVGVVGESTIAGVDPADGSTLWSNGLCSYEYALISDGTKVFCTTDDPRRDLRALDPADGSQLWTHSIGVSGHIGSRIVADDDRVYFDYMTSSDGNLPRRLRALNADTGVQVWDVAEAGNLDYGVSVLGANVLSYEDADAFDGASGSTIANAGDVPRLGGFPGSGAFRATALDQGVFFEWRNTGLGSFELVASTDVTPPVVEITDPATDPSFTSDVTPSIEFSAGDGIGTIDQLEVTVDSDPPESLTPGETSFTPATDLGEGAHTFTVDAYDLMSNHGTDSVEITVDTIPPTTTIDSGPTGLVNDATPTYGFSSNETATFECRFDADAFTACSGPGGTHTPATDLSQGAHTFEVRATDQATNTDATPDSRSITVDTIAPDSSIGSGPSGPTPDSTPTYDFSTDDVTASDECRFDSAPFAPCSGPGDSHTPASPLADGNHTFEYRAVDPAGNADATPASRSITIDTVAPTVTITAGPSGVTSKADATFALGADEAGVAFECSFEGGAFEACTSPKTYPGLADGEYDFELRGTDLVGHPSVATVSRTWEVDASSPTDTTSGTVNEGGTVTTDPAAAGPTAAKPVTAAITVPDGGTVGVTTSAPTTPPPTGYSILGQQFEITAPDATVNEPLVLSFRLDSSAIGATSLELLTVTREGQPAGNCSGASGTAVPDPCVSNRQLLPDGDAVLTVLSSHASTWNLAKAPTPIVTPKKCKKGQRLKKGKCVKKRKKKRKKKHKK